MFNSTEIRRSQVKAYVKTNRRYLVKKHGGLYLFQGSIARVATLNDWGAEPEIQPLAGVVARVDSAGGIAARSTLTRSAVPGMHGWQQKIDTRELYIVIDGPGFQWQVKVPANDGRRARKSVEAINSVSRRYVPPTSTGGPA